MTDAERAELIALAGDLIIFATRMGHGKSARLHEIAKAALEYGSSDHVGDANCRAGDCDSCSARYALLKLEVLVSGPGHT